ncbi:MAG TPA: NADH-quinone oxidoreductase subunit I, partial [Candidatus Polarisedimenticolia bacterium]
MPLIGKQVSRPRNRGLLAASYLPSILKGMWITLRHIFRPKVTMQYPEQTWQLPENYRGLPALVKDDGGRVKCVACF